MDTIQAQLSFAREKDSADPLRKFRDSFYIPQADGGDAIYFCGNSLGLQPKNAEAAIQQELEDWRKFGVLGYTKAKNPWLFYQQQFQQTLSALAGCLEHEVTVMNTLTLNLHILLISFYRPSKQRFKILMEAGAFPSDQYAVETQVRFCGLDPKSAIIEIEPRPGDKLLREEDILQAIEEKEGFPCPGAFGRHQSLFRPAIQHESDNRSCAQSRSNGRF